MDIVRTLAASVLFTIVLAQENSTQRAGKLGHSIKLPCRLPPAKIRWEDTVHSSTREPILIFENQNNPNFIISSNHPNSDNYRVDKHNYDLKISRLTFDDVGTYSCISENGSSVYRQDHYLLIYGPLECSGETQLGNRTTLRCAVKYSGKQPSLTWFSADHALDSVDRSEIIDDSLIAAKELELIASHDMDGKSLRCQMQLADKDDQCEILLNITYPVRDIGFKSGNRDSFYVGEEVTCVARGNPAPEISLVPTSLSERVDDRKKSSIIIPRSWVGMDVSLECTARNTYKSQEEVIRKSMSIHVLEPTTTTTTTTTTTPKPKIEDTPKPVDGNGSSGEGLTSWKGFPLIVLSVTLMKLIAFCC